MSRQLSSSPVLHCVVVLLVAWATAVSACRSGGSGLGSGGSSSGGSVSDGTASGGSVSGGTASGGSVSGGATGRGGSSGSAGATGAGGSNVTGGTVGFGDAGAACRGTTATTAAAATGLPAVPSALTVPTGFKIEVIASIGQARELAALPNGDLLVATSGTNVFLVPNAEGTGAPGDPLKFTTIGDAPVQGVAFSASTCQVFVASRGGIYAMAYADGQTSAAAGNAIAKVRTGPVSSHRPAGDTDEHNSTSVAVAGGKVYAGVGSSCNACVEDDPTRATVQVMNLDGSNMTTRATRFRNAIALATNPATQTLWAGGAGQDNLTYGHPYEFFDAVTLHPGRADYGWPDCEENHTAYTNGASCANTVAPLVELPAYDTIIGAAFYPSSTGGGAHSFPSAYYGGVFLAAHGSWHNQNGYIPPRIAFVPMNGDAPATAVDWSSPTKQWTEFLAGCQVGTTNTRAARPTGLAVGSQGSLFIADDSSNLVYRVRPN